MGLIKNNPALAKTMAWHWAIDKPISEMMLAYFTDTYKWHYACMS